MPSLIKTGFSGKVTWLGRVPDRATSLRAIPLQEVQATFAGVAGESHAGLTRASCSRVVTQYPVGTEIRNVRQFSILSAEELARIADLVGVETFDPGWIGASMVIEGIPDFTNLPPSSRLQIEGVATLTVDMHNRPCNLPAPVIDQDAPGHGKAFKSAARNIRGVLAWVEREGPIRLGDRVMLHVPDQPIWQHLDQARA